MRAFLRVCVFVCVCVRVRVCVLTSVTESQCVELMYFCVYTLMKGEAPPGIVTHTLNILLVKGVPRLPPHEMRMTSIFFCCFLSNPPAVHLVNCFHPLSMLLSPQSVINQ